MKGIYLQQNSPYYWLRYYDKLEQNPSRKRKSVNTKIPITPADKRRANQKQKLEGTPELRRLVKSFKTGLAERDIQFRSGVKLKKDLKLSEGYEEFKTSRIVPGSKKELKLKTLDNYKIAVDHFINSSGNKLIYKYTAQKDYVALLNYFETKKLSINSRSIYTRSLRSLWNYFVKQNYTLTNFIEPVDPEDKDPAPIPTDEMYLILEYFKQDKKYPHHYWIVAFMLLTGCRPSSAIMQLKEDIDFKRKYITIRNIKSGRKKRKEFYRFPLYSALQDLIKEMKTKSGDAGRLFDMYSVVPQNYTWPLSFWKRGIKFLKTADKISDEYTLKQIRPTLASFLINILKMDIYTVKKLLDHSDVKVTDKHYIDFDVNAIRKELDDVNLEQLLNGG